MKFTGTGVALVTPFMVDGTIDFEALGKLVDQVIVGGVDYLVALGTTAETPTLSSEEKLEVLNFIIKHNNKRKPIVVGIGGNFTQEVIATIKAYPIDEVDGILSVVPYYNKPSQEGMYQHFKAIASSTDKSIILYNVPGRTVANMLPETTLRLANEFQNIVAIKEASGNLQQCMELVQGAPNHFSVLSGDDDLVLPQIAIGMNGVISVAANSFPADFSQMVKLALANDVQQAQKLHYKLLSAIKALFAEGNPTGVKYVLGKQGIMQNHLRLPLIPASATLETKLNDILKAL